MQAMKGATQALGSMNKTMNLPSLQRIAMEFERENDIMEQRQEMMDDAIDDAMDVGLEEEGDEGAAAAEGGDMMPARLSGCYDWLNGLGINESGYGIVVRVNVPHPDD